MVALRASTEIWSTHRNTLEVAADAVWGSITLRAYFANWWLAVSRDKVGGDGATGNSTSQQWCSEFADGTNGHRLDDSGDTDHSTEEDEPLTPRNSRPETAHRVENTLMSWRTVR